MSDIPSPSKLNPKIIYAIARAGKIVIHHKSGIYLEPSDIICPKAGVGGCCPT